MCLFKAMEIGIDVLELVLSPDGFTDHIFNAAIFIMTCGPAHNFPDHI